MGELAELDDGIRTMRAALVDYLEEVRAVTARQARLKAELEVAARIQRSAVPHHFASLEQRFGVSIGALLRPAREVGGDFYDVFALDDARLCLLIGDVSGKGLPAALFMMRAATELREALLDTPDAAEAFATANRALCQHNDSNLFVTAFAAIYDRTSRIVTTVNAGHNPPERLGAHPEPLRVAPARVLGFLASSTYQSQTFPLAAGEGLLLYTDGVTEATAADGPRFGDDRLERALAAFPTTDAPAVIEEVAAAVDGFVGDAEPFDDLTMVAFIVS